MFNLTSKTYFGKHCRKSLMFASRLVAVVALPNSCSHIMMTKLSLRFRFFNPNKSSSYYGIASTCKERAIRYHIRRVLKISSSVPVPEHNKEHSGKSQADDDSNDNACNSSSSHAWATCWVDPVVLGWLGGVVGRPLCCRLVRLCRMICWGIARISRGTCWLWKLAAHAHVALQVGAVGIVPTRVHVVSFHTVLAIFTLAEERNNQT